MSANWPRADLLVLLLNYLRVLRYLHNKYAQWSSVLVNPFNGLVLTLVCLTSSVALADSGISNDNRERDKDVSFSKEVAPIIVAKCGKCHVSNARGSYGIGSFEALMKSGSITPNDPASSNFIEVIESGEMPKGGQKVRAEELNTLKNWIAQGAKFDGESESKPFIEGGAQGNGNANGGGRRGGGGGRLKAVEQNPQAIGDAGVAWYATWDTGLAEARRSNRPIFFMSAAAQCTGVPGVF